MDGAMWLMEERVRDEEQANHGMWAVLVEEEKCEQMQIVSRLLFDSVPQSVFSAAVASSNGCQLAQSAIALSVCANDKDSSWRLSLSRLATVRPVHLPPLISSSTLQFLMQLISTFATLCSQCGRR